MNAAHRNLLAIAMSVCLAGSFSFSAFGQVIEILTAPKKIGPGPVRLKISRVAHQVTLYRGETALKTYPIAVGRPGWETPVGNFFVFQTLRDPAWKHPLTGKIIRAGQPGNELGRYWIGFWTNGKICVGFHGTPHPNTVGKSVSHGCLRMLDKDIAELFAQVSLGTRVTVMP